MDNLEHRMYEDEFNKAGNRTKAGKNKQLAQKIGIAYAQKMFDFMKNEKNQGATFEWQTYGNNLKNVACASLFSHFSPTPKNIKELEEITEYAVTTEWKILLEDAKNKNEFLPLKEYAKEAMGM